MTTDTAWVIALPYSAPPLSLNGRYHWAVRNRHTSTLRAHVGWTVRSLNIGRLSRVHVTLHYRPKDNRTRDADNLVATLKPCIDGVRDAEIVPDDTPRYVSWSEPVIHPADKALGPALWLELTT